MDDSRGSPADLRASCRTGHRRRARVAQDRRRGSSALRGRHCRGDFRWADGNGKTFVARPFAIKLLNPALIGGETSAGGGSITGSGSWSFIERLSGGTATDLDAQPTLIIATDFLVLMVGVADPGADGALVNGGGLTAWQLQARAGRDLAAGMIQPLDYNAQTNDRFWVQVQ